ncbi:MAG: class I SAM-dependent methyltransferase [Candidatus Levybacteria bacterium]|nr:class I SAM-dependent methyltransferase [Candidatus Levybacteria bacterium]
MNKIGFKESRISEKHYFEWRKNRAQSAVNRISGNYELKNKVTLDIGCGYGALSSILLSKGAKVYATETDKSKLDSAEKLIKGNKKNIKYLHVKNEILPFKDKFFEVIFLFDVIEHVKKPEIMIEECERILKPEGLLYVEFTPYYSITGHHLYDYTKLPIHALPKSLIKKIVFSKKAKSFMTQEYYWEQFESLNKLRIEKFQKMVEKDFIKVNERFIIKYPELFEINLGFINYFGFFKDYLTMSYEGLFKKT